MEVAINTLFADAPARENTTFDPHRFPLDVEQMMTALDAREYAGQERRVAVRSPHRVQGELRMLSDRADLPRRDIFTRAASVRSLSLISRTDLPVGETAFIAMPRSNGTTLLARGTVIRCRPLAPGWFDAAFHFDRVQRDFAGLGGGSQESEVRIRGKLTSGF